MQLLRVELNQRGPWRVLRLEGQLDVATAPEFRQQLQEAQYGGGQRVVVDLSGLQFLDSFGLGVLVGGLRRARLHGGHLVAAGPSERIRSVFEVTGLAEAFALAASVDEVVAP